MYGKGQAWLGERSKTLVRPKKNEGERQACGYCIYFSLKILKIFYQYQRL